MLTIEEQTIQWPKAKREYKTINGRDNAAHNF